MGTTCVCGVYQIHGFYFFAPNLVLLPFRNADLVSLVYWSGWLSSFATAAKVDLEFGFSGDCVFPFSFFFGVRHSPVRGRLCRLVIAK